MTESTITDAQRLDWLQDHLFERRWNGVIGPGHRMTWSTVSTSRHIRIRLNDPPGNMTGDFRAAIDGAIRACAELGDGA